MHKNRIEHTIASGVRLESNKKLGYYLLNNEIYYNKFQALLEATKTKLPVKWFFNEDEFIKFPWHVEPEESLNELYRQRAQQIRDQYDYVRVEASGGGDSSTVVYSFLLNGIHLDEVVFRYPKQGEKDVSGNPYDTRCENTLSEWEFAAKPLLNWIATNYPNVKITVHDYSEEMLKAADTLDEGWIFKTRHYLQPGHAHKHSATGLIDHRRTADQNLRICVLWGVDKPKVCIKDNKFFLYFNDIVANHNNPDVGEYSNITNEFFYWSPDAMPLMAKQAHSIMKWFSMPHARQLQHVLHWPNYHYAARTLYEQLVKSVIYPDYDSNTFQTVKPTNNIYNEMDHWFHANFKGTQIYQTWEAGIQFLIDNLDDQYIVKLDGKSVDVSGHHFSPFYYLGESTIPDVGVIPAREFMRDKRLSVSPDRTTESFPQRLHVIKGKLVVY